MQPVSSHENNTPANVQRQELLISLGHDRTTEVTDYIYSASYNNLGISLNTDNRCALHLAALHHQTDVVEILCRQFPNTRDRPDRQGCTPLLLACMSVETSQPQFRSTHGGRKITTHATEDISALETLLRHGARVSAQDNQGNTCLHNACAWGNLKAVRALVEAGADPKCTNFAGWLPESYSLTVQADVYFRTLVAEFERQRLEEDNRARERRKTGGRVRMIAAEDDENRELARNIYGNNAHEAGRFMPIRTAPTENGLGINVHDHGYS